MKTAGFRKDEGWRMKDEGEVAAPHISCKSIGATLAVVSSVIFPPSSFILQPLLDNAPTRGQDKLDQ